MAGIFNGKTPRDTVLMSEGEYIIDRLITRDKIREKLDGTFEYEATVAVVESEPSEIYDLLTKGSIIKVADEYGDEIFRIASIKKNRRYIEVYARQITIEETLTLWLSDVRPTDTNGQGALNWIYDNAKGTKEIFVSSDIETINTAYYVDKNMYEAIVSDDNAFLQRWGGEIKRHLYNLSINRRVGQDNGVEIASRKNIVGFDVSESETVITGIKAKGFDGIGDNIIYSPLRNKYPRTYIKEIKYDDVRLKSDDYPEGFETLVEAQAELNRRAEREYSENHVDEIQAEYNIDFVNLAQTEEYKDIQATQQVGVGDTIKVRIDTFDININVRCISREYSPKLRKRLTTKLSTKDINRKPPQISDILAELDKVETGGFKGLSGYINSMLNAGFKDSYYISRPNEALWLDNPDINLAKNVVRINKSGIGFSTTGYYGNYTYGFTIDGKINASLIATGILSTILIQNSDGSFQIDLSGKGGALFKSNDQLAMKIENNSMSFYNWGKDSSIIGSIASLLRDSGGEPDPNKPSIGLSNERNSSISIGYRGSRNLIYPYVRFDEYNVSGDNATAPIRVFEDVEFKNKSIKNSRLKADNVQEISVGGNIIAYFDDNKLVVQRDLKVLGSKNCIQKTKNYGNIDFYANEDVNSLLTRTNVNEWHETKLAKDGTYKCVVKIPDYLKECVNTDDEYIVWIDKKGFGDYYYNAYAGYFVVISDRPIRFRYKLEGKRRGFENEGENNIMV